MKKFLTTEAPVEGPKLSRLEPLLMGVGVTAGAVAVLLTVSITACLRCRAAQSSKHNSNAVQ